FFVVNEADLNRVPADLKGVDPDDRAGDTLTHVRVHALDHRHDCHQEPDRHDDPEQREERTELVTPRGLERLEDRFGEGHETGNLTGLGTRGSGLGMAPPGPEPRVPSPYSYLSASTGSSRAAFLEIGRAHV